MDFSEDFGAGAPRARVTLLTNDRAFAKDAREGFAPHGYALEAAPLREGAGIPKDRDAAIFDLRGLAAPPPDVKEAVHDAKDGAPALVLLSEDASPAMPAAFGGLAEAVFEDTRPVPALTSRVRQMLRLRTMTDEARLRLRTLRASGATPPAARRLDDGPLRILTLAGPSRHFLAVSAALQAAGVEVTGAISSATAFDYLEQQNFDAVIGFPADDETVLPSVCAAMRRNTRLYNTPVIAVADKTDIDANALMAAGVTEILDPARIDTILAKRASAFGAARRREDAMRTLVQNMAVDEACDPSGAFSRRFFARHFPALAEKAETHGRSLSLICLRIIEYPEISTTLGEDVTESLVHQLTDLITLLVRAEDTAARINKDAFVIALPATNAADASIAARRLAGVVGHSRFIGREDDGGIALHLQYGVVDHQPGAATEETLAQALADMARKAA